MKFLEKFKRKVQRIIFKSSYSISFFGRLYLKKRFNLSKDELALISWHQSGETYLLCSMIDSFKKSNQIDCPIILIGTKAYHRQIYEMFKHKIARYYQIEHHVSEYLQDLRIVKKGKMFFSPDLPLWRLAAVEPFDNLELLRKCNFINQNLEFSPPIIDPINVLSAKEKFDKMGLARGKTIMLCPETVSMGSLPKSFWKLLCSELTKDGYKIFLNIMDQSNAIEGTQTCFLNFSESIIFAGLCGNVIALRSGFCEVISTAEANFWVIYPFPRNLQTCSLKEIIRNRSLSEYVIENIDHEQLVKTILSDIKSVK